MLLELKTAISLQQLHLVYQPKMDLASGKVVGCESLLRWCREDGTSVPPGEFIQLAEESGLISRLGNQMFHDVCRQAKEWNDKGMLRGPIAVNLTQRQLKEPGMLDRFIQAIEKNGLQPECFELEITENAIMSDLDLAMTLMKRIQDVGIGLAIDDFGTGYSSLGYIKNFPVQTLKLDNLFVDGLPDDSDAIAVAKTVLSLAEGLSLKVVAEGVESEAQREFLKTIGCDMIQGYLLSPPMEAERYQQWLADRER
jgi:EAL domain-containing protein (putative c-di-GMP-specific phosphodiesterase class I)